MNSISKTFSRRARRAVSRALPAAFALVAVLAMGSGQFESSGTAFADTPIIFTGGGGSVGSDQVLGLNKHCDHYAKEAAKKSAEAAKFAAKNGKQSATQAAKKASEAARELQKFHDCLAKLVVASVLNAPDRQAKAAALGLNLEAISAGTLTWDAIKWDAIKWDAVQLDSIKWDMIKWNGGGGDLGLQ